LCIIGVIHIFLMPRKMKKIIKKLPNLLAVGVTGQNGHPHFGQGVALWPLPTCKMGVAKIPPVWPKVGLTTPNQ